MSTLKILQAHIVDDMQQYGGAEKVFITLGQKLKEDASLEVFYAVNRGVVHDRLSLSGHKIFELPEKKNLKAFELIRVFQEIINACQPQVVHSHHRHLTFILSLFFRHRVKILHTQHVEMFDKRYLSLFGHHVAAVSQGVKQNLIKFFKVSENKITVVYNGLPQEEVNDRRRAALAAELNINPDRVVISCIARFTEQKGHRYLVEAVS
ncbi:MAG: glycosyltransferase, partial [Deltaproteobacteria bacterium]|nr:glycosyltransferase [Deltaproteobacteria bacterium]